MYLAIIPVLSLLMDSVEVGREGGGMDRMDKASQSNVVIKLWSYYNRTPYVSSPSSLTRENVVARLIAAAASTLPYPATFALSHTMWAVVAFLVLPSSLSLFLLLFVGKKKAVIGTVQERWRVATRAFNRDKRSCHGTGNGIAKVVSSSLYRPRFICIKVRATYNHRSWLAS